MSAAGIGSNDSAQFRTMQMVNSGTPHVTGGTVVMPQNAILRMPVMQQHRPGEQLLQQQLQQQPQLQQQLTSVPQQQQQQHQQQVLLAAPQQCMPVPQQQQQQHAVAQQLPIRRSAS
jgi:hypothetical protein